jgi:hypothetical protein
MPLTALGSFGRSVMHTSRHWETGRPRAAQFAPRAVYIPGGSVAWCEGRAQDGDSRSALRGAGRGWRGVPGAGRAGQPAFGAYLRGPGGIRHVTAFYVLTLAGDQICGMTRFEASVLPWFGLPRSLPGRQLS